MSERPTCRLCNDTGKITYKRYVRGQLEPEYRKVSCSACFTRRYRERLFRLIRKAAQRYRAARQSPCAKKGKDS